MTIDVTYRDENGIPINIGDYIVQRDTEDPNKLYLYKLDFYRKDATIICKSLRKVKGEVQIVDYDALTDIVNLYYDMSEEGNIKGFTKIKASTYEEAYSEYEKMLTAAESKPLQLFRLRKENPQLYYTIKAMQAGDIDWLEVNDKNELIEWSYEITADESKYYVKETTIDGKEKKVENYVVKI